MRTQGSDTKNTHDVGSVRENGSQTGDRQRESELGMKQYFAMREEKEFAAVRFTPRTDQSQRLSLINECLFRMRERTQREYILDAKGLQKLCYFLGTPTEKYVAPV